MGEQAHEVLVLGVGNTLLKDEGIGVHVIQALRRLKLPGNVAVLDGGVGGIDLLEHIQQATYLIVVDALDAGAEPGAIFRFRAEEVDVIVNEHKASLHQVDLYDTLKIAKFLGCYPQTIIVGVQPKEMTWGTEPTPELTAKIPLIVDLGLREVGACQNQDLTMEGVKRDGYKPEGLSEAVRSSDRWSGY
jgi:hydrogenase maturation protease